MIKKFLLGAGLCLFTLLLVPTGVQASTLTNVSVSSTNPVVGATTRLTFTYTIASTTPNTERIFNVRFDLDNANFDLTEVFVDAVRASDDGVRLTESFVSIGTSTITVGVAQEVVAGSIVVITVDDVLNPSIPGEVTLQNFGTIASDGNFLETPPAPISLTIIPRTFTASNCSQLETAATNATSSNDLVNITANIDNSCGAVFGSSTPFLGTFEGNGYTITQSVAGTPLFYQVTDATIQNLTVDGTIALGGVEPFGPLGSLVTGGVYDNVTSSVHLISTDEGDISQIGGFIGRIEDETSDVYIRNSAFTGSITLTGIDRSFWAIGGLIGEAESSYDDRIYVTSTVVSGEINLDAGDVFGIGSFIGMLGSFGEGFASVGTGMWIENATSSLDIDIETRKSGIILGSAAIGGIAGFSSTEQAFIVSSTVSSGNITASSSDGVLWIGGIVGVHWSDEDILVIYNSSNSGDITVTGASNQTDAVGIGGIVGNFTSDEIVMQNTESSGDINIEGAANSIGGIIGEFVGELLDGYRGFPIDASLTDVMFTGDINVSIENENHEGEDSEHIGGIVGYNLFTELSLQNATSTADITIDYASPSTTVYAVGGIIGTIDVDNEDDFVLVSSTYYTGDIQIDSNEDIRRVGGIVGDIQDGGIILYDSVALVDISVTSTESGEDGSIDSVGGLIGRVNDSDPVVSMSESYVIGTLTLLGNEKVDNIGGAVGLSDNTAATFDQVYAVVTTTITIATSSYDFIQGVGGFIGDQFVVTSSVDYANISNSFAVGSILITVPTAVADGRGVSEIGGFIGEYDNGTLQNAYADVDIIIVDGTTNTTTKDVAAFLGEDGKESSDIYPTLTNVFAVGTVSISSAGGTPVRTGGFIGDYQGATVLNSYFDVTRTDQSVCSTVGSIAGCSAYNTASAASGKLINTNSEEPVDEWNFDTIWQIDEDYYPVLAFAPYDGSVTLGTEVGEEEQQSSGGGTYVPPTPPRTVNSSLESIEMDEDGARISGAFTINNGAAETNNSTVTLTFTDIENTAQVAVSESPTFAGASYQPFVDALSYTLSTGNGTKTVYAKLRSPEGATLVLKDTILLTGTVEEPPTPGTTETPINPTQALQCTSNVYLTNAVGPNRVNNPQDVRLLEEFLNTYENANLPVNGIYEPADIVAVIAWQEKYAADILTPWGISNGTGYVFTTSLAKIKQIHEENCATATQPTLPPTAPNTTPTSCLETTQTLTLGMNNTLVATAQRLLKKLGYFPADIDTTGYFGTITRTATVDFQAANNIQQLGIIGPQTRARLNELGC